MPTRARFPTCRSMFALPVQGMIGYMISNQCETNSKGSGLTCRSRRSSRRQSVDAMTPLSRTRRNPSGPFYTESQSGSIEERKRLASFNDSERGYRRTVPSPIPLSIVQGQMIRELMDLGTIVIAEGGGGIPVTSGIGLRH